MYNVIYLPLTCQFLTHANPRAQSLPLLSEGKGVGGRQGEKGNKTSRCIITRRLNKNFQNVVLYSTERDQSAFKNIKGGGEGGVLNYLLLSCMLILPLTSTVSNYDPLQILSDFWYSDQTAPQLLRTQP